MHFFPFGALAAHRRVGERHPRRPLRGGRPRPPARDRLTPRPTTRRRPMTLLRRPADRAGRRAQAARRRGCGHGHRDPPTRGLRRARRQDQALGDRRARGPAEGEVRGRVRGHADAAGRGQDDHHGRSRPGAVRHRAAGHGGDPAAVDGPDVRDQGRRGRGRLQPGRAHGRAQPAPDRRLPRRDRGAQPAVGRPGQPPLPGQRRGHRPARHHLAPGARRQRPRAAQRDRRSRQQDGRDPAPDRVRHHRRERGHGDLRARRVRCRRCASGSAGSSSATPRTARRSPRRTSAAPAP